MRFSKVRVQIERRPPPLDRVWWKTFTAGQGFILAGLGLLLLVTGNWLWALLSLAIAAWTINDAWRRFG